MFTDEELMGWNRRGLIPGPGMSQGQFAAKVALLEGLGVERVKLGDAFEEAIERFDIKPDWLSLIHSRQGLCFWEGAATWQDLRPEGFCVPAIQVREDFDRMFFSRWYALDELLAHEVIHAVRCDFREPVFEEVLAYQTAEKTWRRWLGPILQNPAETKCFLVVLLLAVVAQWGGYLFSWPVWCDLFVYLPWAVVLLGGLRLSKNQGIFKRCLKHLEGVVGQHALAVILRLTDREIVQFSQWSKEEIVAYAAREARLSVRWKMLTVSYPLLPLAATGRGGDA